MTGGRHRAGFGASKVKEYTLSTQECPNDYRLRKDVDIALHLTRAFNKTIQAGIESEPTFRSLHSGGAWWYMNAVR